MNEAPTQAELFDLHSMPKTNEQKILAALEQIVVLLTPKTPSREEQLSALVPKNAVRRK